MLSLHTFNQPLYLKTKALGLFLVVVLFLIVLEVWAVNRLATFGLQISKLERTKSDLRLENQVLRNKIAKKASLSQIEILSKNLGFVGIKTLQYVSDSGLALGH